MWLFRLMPVEMKAISILRKKNNRVNWEHNAITYACLKNNRNFLIFLELPFFDLLSFARDIESFVGVFVLQFGFIRFQFCCFVLQFYCFVVWFQFCCLVLQFYCVVVWFQFYCFVVWFSFVVLLFGFSFIACPCLGLVLGLQLVFDLGIVVE